MFKNLKKKFIKQAKDHAPAPVTIGEALGEKVVSAVKEKLLPLGELAGLTMAGIAFVPPASAVEPEPILAVLKVDPVEEKVLTFLRVCHLTSGLTYREISGGCDLPIADVRHALESLEANGKVKHSDEAEPNYRRYMLTEAILSEQPAPAQDSRTADQRWAAEARKNVIDAEAANRPPIVRPTVPPLDEIVLPEPAAPLTAEERRLHDLLIPANRVSRNQQEAIKR